MHCARHLPLAAIALMLISVPAVAQSGTEAQVADARIEQAIAQACQTLRRLQRPDDGSWDDYPGYPGASTALAVQALLLAGEPPDSPSIQKAAIALTRVQIEKTYARACRAMAYALLVRHYPELRAKLAGDTSWLSRNQLGDGMWGYNTRRENKGRGDNSNTQFAVIGLRDASLAGIEVSQSVWSRLLKHYTKTQNNDGGWSYRPPDPKQENRDDIISSVSVTAPSLASLMIVNDELAKTSGCPCSSGRSGGTRLQKKHTEKGIQWLIDYFGGNIKGAAAPGRWKTYFYYGLQRAGQASGLKTFGRHNWYRRGSSTMHGQTKISCRMKYVPSIHNADSDLNKKRKDFKAPRVLIEKDSRGNEKKYVVNPGSVVDVSLAIIFLVKGNAPVYMNKLKYDGDWNRHRRDLALVTQIVAKRLERPFRWQVVDVRSDPLDWRKDSPLLYLSGEEDLRLSADDREAIKTFCARGGTLLVESNCGNSAFATKARALVKDLWPDWPLKPLLQTHPIYDCQLKIDTEGLFEGVDDGIRTFVLYTDSDLSCAWQMRNIVKDKAKFDMAINLYSYATDKAPPPARLTDTEKMIEERRKALEDWRKAVLAERVLAKKEKRRPKRIPKPGRKTQADMDVDISMVTPGAKNLITVNLLKHKGNYKLGLHYEILSMLIGQFQKKIGVTLAMGEPVEAGDIDPGLPDVLIVRGDQPMGLTAEEKTHLANYLRNGGFVIAEAAMGRAGFHNDFQEFIQQADGLDLAPLGADDAFLNGEIDEGIEGIEVATALFSRTVREESPGIKTPIIMTIKAGEKIVGYYSPLDLCYSSTGYVAYGIRGYDKNSAMAILINMFLKPTKGMAPK